MSKDIEQFLKIALIELILMSALFGVFSTRYAGVQSVPGGTVVWFGSNWAVLE
jgi:hypothetical protein